MRPAVKRAFESMNKDGEIDELVKSMQHHQNEMERKIYKLFVSDDVERRMLGKKLYHELIEGKTNHSFDKSRVPNFDAIPQSKEQAKNWLKESKEELDFELITQDEFDKIKEEIKPYILAKVS